MSNREELRPEESAGAHPNLPIVLTVAGSDSSAGAGIGVDLRVFQALETYGTFVITAVTAQNTVGVRCAHSVPGETVTAQLESIFEDLPVAAIKTGMLGTRDVVSAVADFLDTLPEVPPLIVDPVWISESGTTLLPDDAWEVLIERILPRTELVTPNRQEAARLLGQNDITEGEIASAAKRILQLGARNVLIKGGHFEGGQAKDFVADRTQSYTLSSPRRDLGRVHGTGCALSAAIAAERAKGQPLDTAIKTARDHLLEWLDQSSQLGQGARILYPKPL
jgi:hydroxymethylpyrimidine/phosphomethylpyrimidine kinase